MSLFAALCALLLLGVVCVCAQAGSGGGATGGQALNVTLYAFCNNTECEAFNASGAGGAGSATTSPNGTVITLGECMPYQLPRLDCVANATTDTNSTQPPAYGNVTAQWLSFVTTSCSNETSNDTITMWVRGSPDFDIFSAVCG